MSAFTASCVRLFLLGLATASGFSSDIISDIVMPQADEHRALEIKRNEFWQSIQKAATDTKIAEHQAVYADVEKAIETLPTEYRKVKEMLSEALLRLRRADERVLWQTLQSRELATERLGSGPPSENMFSFLTGGQSFFSLMIKQFVGGGYSERVSQQLATRQAAVLPALRGSASAASDVLADCRVVSKLGFDALKFDIYHEGVPMTPACAVAAANKLIYAAAQTRRQFLRGVTGVTKAISKDAQEENANPSAIVTQTLLPELSPFGSKLKHPGSAVGSKEKLVLAF